MPDAESALSLFTSHIERTFDVSFSGYAELQVWACENPDRFWSTFLDYSSIQYSGDAATVLTDTDFVNRQFFPDVSLNYSRNLLSGYDRTKKAVTVVSESGDVVSVTRQELISLSMSVAAALREMGIDRGDRVVAIACNSIESIAACLAAAAIGATWSSVSPELGVHAIQERFGQLEPRLMFADNNYTSNGITHDISSVLTEIAGNVSSIEHLIYLSGTDFSSQIRSPEQSGETANYQEYCWVELTSYEALCLTDLEDFPFDHPLFVMFSSGTTGAPKCIVHGVGGTLIEHVKEHRLHGGLTNQDSLLFQTSTGWMMWNWQLSALASGTHIILYDGSVSYPDKTHLLDVIEEQGVTVFGTSPAYIQFLIESGVTPVDSYKFQKLRSIQSTGSVLYESQFEWIDNAFKNIPVQSVSGGTDMIGCLVLGHPDMPVKTGDSQCVSLGIDVQVKSESGISRAGEGELVVVKPFPSQPVFFWNDPGRQKLITSYFESNPGVWTHGDEIRITTDGSPRILGRSDGTLNIRGVRIGPAEILTIVNQVKPVRESMVVEQSSPREPGGTRLVLLLVMHDDTVLERSLVLQIKKRLANDASRLHVPAVVVQVSALPRTHNGKLSEKAARDAVNGNIASNLSALVNPDVLTEIAAVVPEPLA